MHRRSFLTLLGGASAAGWSLAASAQQDGRVRRIGWLTGEAENAPGSSAERAAFREGLSALGWVEGRNLQIDLRFGANDPDHIHASAAELVRLAPDAIVTDGGAPINALRQLTQTIPIVFTGGPDPAAIGLLRNISRPEGNFTGFVNLEPSIIGKSLELLKEVAPRLSRVAIVFNPDLSPTAPAYVALIEAAAPTLGVKTFEMPIGNAISIVRALDTFAAVPNGGLLVLPPRNTIAIRETIIPLAAEHRLPAIYPGRSDAAAGGLLAYAIDRVEQSRRAATYVDRLLRGAKISELPVQFPTKFELVVNLKTAKATGLTIPEAFLLRADEVIE